MFQNDGCSVSQLVAVAVTVLCRFSSTLFDDHSIKSAGGASLVSKDVFSKNHLAMLKI